MNWNRMIGTLKSQKYIVTGCFLWVLVSLSMLLSYYTEWTRAMAEPLKYFWLALYLGMTLVLAVICTLFVRKVRIEWIFVAASLLIGIIFLFVIPPFSGPDEGSHFVTAYAQSGELLGEKVYDDEGNIVVASEVLWDTGKWSPTKETYIQFMLGALGQTEVVHEELATRPPLAASFLGYAPQVLGITVARLLRMNHEQLLLLGRLFALLWYCFVMFWALKWMPIRKGMLFIVGILPMTMQQVVSYNYDSVLFGACFFVIAYLLHLLYDIDKIRLRDIIILAAAVIVIGAIKFIYLPVIGLAVLIPKEKFGGIKKKTAAGAGVIALSVVTIMITKLSTLWHAVSTQPAQAGEPVVYSLADGASSPLLVIRLCYRTVERQLSDYIAGMTASPLGYPDIGVHIPDAIVLGLVFVLVFGVLQAEPERIHFTRSLKLYMGALVGLVGILVMLALFTCTGVGSDEIWGIQGRYFLPVLPLFLLMLQNDVIVIRKNLDKYLILFVGYLDCMAAFFYTSAIVSL